MASYGPSSAFLLVGGINVTPDSNTLIDSAENVLEEKHSLGDSWEEHLPVGIGKVTLQADGSIFDTTALRALAKYEAIYGSPGILDPADFITNSPVLTMWGFEGSELGDRVAMVNGDYVNKLSRLASRDALTKVNAEHIISGQLYHGRVLHGFTESNTDDDTLAGAAPKGGLDQGTDTRLNRLSITSISVANPTHVVTATEHNLETGDYVIFYATTTTPSLLTGLHQVTKINATEFTVAVNVTVSPANTDDYCVKVSPTGAIFDLHCLLFTGGGTHVTITVLDSPDDDTYSSLVAFTNVTASGTSERKTVAGAVARYLGLQWAFQNVGAGTPEVVPFVAVSR